MKRDERLHLESLKRERERLRAWLRRIVVDCRGKAIGLASQALHSDRWPDWPEHRKDNSR